MRLRREDGSAVVEFPLAIMLLLIPMAYLALMFAPWFARRNMAELAAAEAARAIVTSVAAEPDNATARALGYQIAANHGIPAGEVTVHLCGTTADSNCGTLVRGDTIRVEVAVVMPAVSIPLIGDGGSTVSSGGCVWTAVHEERVDLYRSFP